MASRDPHYGGAGYIYDRHSIRWHSVESRLEDYAPLHVTEAQANSILDWLSPDVVLCGAVRDASGERRSLEDAVCFAALSRRIPVLQFVEGWEVWYPRTWTERLADRYLVIDEKAQALLQSYGVQDPYIGVVGYPRSLFDPEVIDLGTRRLVRAKLLDHDGRRLIVCFGQVTTDNAKTLSWIAHCLEPADVLVFQRHPRDQRSSDELFGHCPPGSVREIGRRNRSDLPRHGLLREPLLAHDVHGRLFGNSHNFDLASQGRSAHPLNFGRLPVDDHGRNRRGPRRRILPRGLRATSGADRGFSPDCP